MNRRELFLNHYAFLVGIDEYDHFPNLQGAHSDATTLRDALSWVGYPDGNISVVSSEKTTLGNLKREIRKFLWRVTSQNSNPEIVVFWAGHGVPGDDGGFLIAQNPERDSADWHSWAGHLKWFADQFVGVGPASEGVGGSAGILADALQRGRARRKVRPER